MKLYLAVTKLIYLSSILAILIFLWTITFGQATSWEFRNQQLASDFYGFILFSAPVAVILTLFGTLKRTQDIYHKIAVVTGTIIGAFLIMLIGLSTVFSIGVKSPREFHLVYYNKRYPRVVLGVQPVSTEVFGSGKGRFIKFTPKAWLFYEVQKFDSLTIDTNEWIMVPGANQF